MRGAGLCSGEGNRNHSWRLFFFFLRDCFCVRFCVAPLSLWSVPWKGILLVFTQPIYFAADGNSGEMAFPLHEPVVCISTTPSKPAYLSAKHSGFYLCYITILKITVNCIKTAASFPRDLMTQFLNKKIVADSSEKLFNAKTTTA